MQLFINLISGHAMVEQPSLSLFIREKGDTAVLDIITVLKKYIQMNNKH